MAVSCRQPRLNGIFRPKKWRGLTGERHFPTTAVIPFRTRRTPARRRFDGVIAVDSSANAYVTGATSSTDFPTSAGAFQTTPGGGDAFVTKLNPTGCGLGLLTYLGGSSFDFGVSFQKPVVDDKFGATLTLKNKLYL
jgi:hypothetical protein